MRYAYIVNLCWDIVAKKMQWLFEEKPLHLNISESL